MANTYSTRALATELLEFDDEMTASVLLRGLPIGTCQIDVSANVSLNGRDGAWLPAALPFAMKYRTELRLSGRTDSVCIANATDAQNLLSSWYEDLEQVDIVSDGGVVPDRSQDRGIGCFFSGGADSFYSAIDRSSAVTHLIFVTGFDIDVDDDDLSRMALDGARSAAKSLGKELIEVKTNIRHASEGLLDWGTHYHGAALATVGLLLGDVLEHVIIPASYHSSDLFPWGSHPALDPLWSSSSVSFEHHGTSTTRPKKVERISTNDAAMDHLRICWENPGGSFNCGQCEKCIRTMVNLYVVGALERCKTLPNDIDMQLLRSFRPEHGSAIFANQNLEAMKEYRVQNRELARTLRRMVMKAHVWEVLRSVRNRFLRR